MRDRRKPLGLENPIEVFRQLGVTDPSRRPVALVLSGGGARGAYQAGVARFLAEVGTPVTAIAGASIGALNGAVLASAASVADGAARLGALWHEVATAAGSAPHGDGPGSPESTLTQARNLPARLRSAVFSRGYLDQLVTKHVDLRGLRDGLPLWVSVFPSVDPALAGREWWVGRLKRPVNGPIHAAMHPRFGFVVDVIRAKLGTRAEWVWLNGEPDDAIYQALLASAALPIVLPPRAVRGRIFRDGGLADNAPAGALVGELEHRRVLVVHLEPLPMFSAKNLRGLDVVEIVPSAAMWPTGPLGKITGLVDLSPDRVDELLRLGYDDARSQLGAVWQHERGEDVGEFLDAFRHRAVDELDQPP